jgi:hypothetical protein
LRKALRGTVVVAALVGAFWLYRVLFPSDEEQVRRLLQNMVESAAVIPNEAPLARLAKANRLAGFFTADVVINLDEVPADVANIVGRDQLLQVTLAARANLQQLRVQLLGLTVEIDPNALAATALTTVTAEVNGEQNAVAQELRFRLRKTERRWLIAEVNTIRSLGLHGARQRHRHRAATLRVHGNESSAKRLVGIATSMPALDQSGLAALPGRACGHF